MSLQTDTVSLRGVRKHDVAIHSLLEMDCFANKWLAIAWLILAMTFSPVQAAWFNGDWSSREKITIKASQVNGDLSEFPIYLNLADLPDIFFTTVNGTGADIRMTLADEVTEASFELVEIDTVNGTGELWFKAPFLSSTTDTDFYIYYGNPTATAYTDTDLYGTHNVWSNGFVAVYHMNENPTGAIKDSTQYTNDGTSGGGMNLNNLARGHLGQALRFDGINDTITIPDHNSLDVTEVTMSAWIQKNNSVGYTGIIAKGYWDGGGEAYSTHLRSGTNLAWIDLNNSGTRRFIQSNTSVKTKQWSKMDASSSSTGTEIFLEGKRSVSNLSPTVLQQTNHPINLGFLPGFNYLNGILDEVRVSGKKRSDNWISTEHSNQNSPGNFYLVANGNVTGFNPSLWSNKHKITIPAAVINGDLENFPVYVDLADLPLSFFGAVQASGADIRITKADQETQLAFELVEINTVNKTGELWFKADNLSSTQDNIFYLWFGNSQAQAYSRVDEFGSENVWTEGYIGVWHMNEDPSQGQILDSTQNKFHGLSNGAMTNNALILGQLGTSLDFDGIDDALNMGSINMTSWSEVNQSVWFKTNDDEGGIISHMHSGIDDIMTWTYLGNIRARIDDGTVDEIIGSKVNDSVLHYSSMNFNGGRLNSYTDSNLESEIPANFNFSTAISNTFNIAQRTLVDPYHGLVDEVHLSNQTRNKNWIKTEYLNQKDTGVFYTIDNGDLNNTAWSNLYKIKVLASQVNGNLTDFPVYVNLSHLPSDFFNVVNGTGADIRITTSDRKTQTAFELVSLDTANGQGELWFKAPFLSSSTDTDFYLLVGNPNAEAYTEDHIFGAQNVWSNGFVAVYHLNEDPSTSSRAIKDSTKYNNDGTSNGAMTNSDLVTGQLGKAIDFDGSNDFINFGTSEITNIVSDIYVSSWININSYGNYGAIVTRQVQPYNGGWGLVQDGSNNLASINFNGPSFSFTAVNTNPLVSTWNKLAFQTSGGIRRSILNSIEQTSTSSLLPTPSPANLVAGRFYSNFNNYYLNGRVDEINISNKARSTSWIKTEYNNQSSPSTFYTTEKINRTNAVMFGRMF